MGPISILVIDNDPSVRGVFQEALESAGYVVTCAPDGRRGLASFRQSRPDLVVTDLVMPEVDGIELIIEMRKVDASLPIIAMSGMGNSNLLETARKLGATDILAKPFEPDEMLGKVAALVR